MGNRPDHRLRSRHIRARIKVGAFEVGQPGLLLTHYYAEDNAGIVNQGTLSWVHTWAPIMRLLAAELLRSSRLSSIAEANPADFSCSFLAAASKKFLAAMQTDP